MAHVNAFVPPATMEDSSIIQQLSVLALHRNVAGYMFANSSIRDRIIPYCSPATLIRVSWTCHELHRVVQDYFTQTYDINKHLRRFVDDPVAFRSLQARTGALIAGSNALQFFAQVVYEEGDLDIYVESRRALPVGQWLMQAAGYLFEPNGRDPNQQSGASFEQAVAEEDHAIGVEYTSLRPKGVYTFFKAVTTALSSGDIPDDQDALVERRKVQVISCAGTPMQQILRFYSTHVMNIISFDRAYSLYPFSTFENRLGLVTKIWYGMDKTIDKYEERGWHFTLPPSVVRSSPRNWRYQQLRKYHRESESLPAVLSPRPRWTADQYSWVIKLSLDGLEIPAGLAGDPCYVSTWSLGRQPYARKQLKLKAGDISHSFTLVRVPSFLNTYVTTDQRTRIIMSHCQSLQEHLPGGVSLDDDLFRIWHTLMVEEGLWRRWHSTAVGNQ